MKLEQSFEVAAPLERVWEALVDVERVAPCLPGAAVTGRNDDGSYKGTFSVKIGPTSASYSGKLAMEAIDESAHTATMQANGTDKRGQGGAKATIVSKLTALEGKGTSVEVVTDYHITGRLARFGRGGMIEDISERLLRRFAQCLQESLAGPAQAPGHADAASPASEPTPVAAEEMPPPAPAPLDTPPPPPAPAERPPPQAPTGTPSFRPAPAEEPIHGLSLVSSVLWQRTRRNPAPAIAGMLGLLLGLALLRRRLGR
jgi:carbon monoxide dehydrogenase subunit G